jgi:hypothetical protein
MSEPVDESAVDPVSEDPGFGDEWRFALWVWFWIVYPVLLMGSLCSITSHGFEWSVFQLSIVGQSVIVWQIRDAPVWRRISLLAVRGRWLCGAVCLTMNALPACLGLILPSISRLHR